MFTPQNVDRPDESPTQALNQATRALTHAAPTSIHFLSTPAPFNQSTAAHSNRASLKCFQQWPSCTPSRCLEHVRCHSNDWMQHRRVDAG